MGSDMTFDDRDPKRAAPAPASRRKLLPWLIGGAVLLLLLLLLSRCGGDRDEVEDPTVASPPAASTVAPASGVGATAAAGAASPTGLSQLDTYLSGSEAAPRTFAFERLHFDTASRDIRAQDRDEVAAVAAALKRHADSRVRLIGYADARGSAPTNAQLGQARADVVRSALIAAGVDGRRIEAVSGGEAAPVDTNATSAGMAENRRTELVVLQR